MPPTLDVHRPTSEAELIAGYRVPRAEAIPLERCTGETPDCPHVECPDGWHYGIDLPCGCTPDCATEDAAVSAMQRPARRRCPCAGHS